MPVLHLAWQSVNTHRCNCFVCASFAVPDTFCWQDVPYQASMEKSCLLYLSQLLKDALLKVFAFAHSLNNKVNLVELLQREIFVVRSSQSEVQFEATFKESVVVM